MSIEIRPEHALLAFLVSLALAWGASAALIYTRQIPWPFGGSAAPSGTYGRVMVYLPFMIFSLFSLLWLKAARVPFGTYFRWRRFSFSLAAGLLLSVGYAAWLFYSRSYPLKGPEFLPPVILLILMNSFSEEILFRLVLLLLLIRRYPSFFLCNGIQAGVYAVPHLAIGGPVFFLYAFIYGLVLGWVVRSNRSIVPAFLCHMIIDIGAIGLPLMIARQY